MCWEKIGHNEKTRLQTLKYGEGDTIGCGFCPLERKVFFTLNGSLVKREFGNVEVEELLPALGFKKISSKVTFNFGLAPFAFKIREHVQASLSDLQRYMASSLTPGKSPTSKASTK